jgi:HNH endonuclease
MKPGPKPRDGCIVEGCERKHLAKGLCRAHYLRMYKHGSLDLLTMRGASVLERIVAKIVVQLNECWLFTGALTPGGYGHVRDDDGNMRLTHVIMYEAKYGPIGDGMESDHLCRCRACCNPDHIEPVTHLENVRRGNCAATARACLMALSPAERTIRARAAANKRWRIKQNELAAEKGFV